MDNVENISTVFVEKQSLRWLWVESVEKLSTAFVDKQAHIPKLQLMSKTHPLQLWKNGRLEDRFVDDVENLSTGFVEKTAPGPIPVDIVEKLCTGFVENSTDLLNQKKR